MRAVPSWGMAFLNDEYRNIIEFHRMHLKVHIVQDTQNIPSVDFQGKASVSFGLVIKYLEYISM